MSGHDSTASGFLYVDAESKAPYSADELDGLTVDAALVIAKYPQKRSALLPLLHLVQSVDGYITGRGVTFCAEQLDLTEAEVSGVATFYTQYKRHPNGEFTVGVCTNTLCAVMGGDQIFDTVSDHLGIGHDETTDDGRVTLERIECNAACDYAPVVMANWEFFDNQTPESTVRLVDDLRAGKPVRPTRGADEVVSFKAVSRVLAGFNDGRGHEGVGAGPASLLGLGIAKERDWVAPGDAHRDGSVERESDGPEEAHAEPTATSTASPVTQPAGSPDGAPASANDEGPTSSKKGDPLDTVATGDRQPTPATESGAPSRDGVSGTSTGDSHSSDSHSTESHSTESHSTDTSGDRDDNDDGAAPAAPVGSAAPVEAVDTGRAADESPDPEARPDPEALAVMVEIVEVVVVAEFDGGPQELAPTPGGDTLITGMPSWNPDAAPASSAPQYAPVQPAADPFEAGRELDEADEATVRRFDLTGAQGAEPFAGTSGARSGSSEPDEPVDEADAATVLRSSVNPQPGAISGSDPDAGSTTHSDEDVDGEKDPR